MVSTDIDLAGPPARRIHPLVIWLAACGIVWGCVGYFLYSLVPIVQCFGEDDDKERVTCAAALEHRLAKGEFRQAILRKQVDHLVAAEKYAEALTASDEIVAAGRATAADYASRGLAWKSDDKPAEAVDDYRKALALDPGNEDNFTTLMLLLYDLERFDDARGVAAAFMKAEPKSAVGYNWLGWTDYRDGRYAAATANLRKAADMQPDNAAYQNELALNLEKEGKTEEALAFYGKAIALYPTYDSYLVNRALLYRDLKRHGEAQADLINALKLTRDHSTIVHLARSYTSDAKYDLAEPLVREALALMPEDESAHIARIRLDYFRGDYRKARDSIAAFQKISPGNLNAVYWLASVEDREGNSEKALTGYRSLLDQWPDDAELRADIGHVLADLDRLVEALPYFSEAIRLSPRDVNGHEGRARAYNLLRDWHSAIADADTAISLDSKSGVSYCRRAYAEWKLKDMPAARLDYEMAAGLTPNTRWIQEEHAEFLIDDGEWPAAAVKIDAIAAKWAESNRASELRKELELAKALAVRSLD
jgi:tetratricopeptide (TPR) repeat protein